MPTTSEIPDDPIESAILAAIEESIERGESPDRELLRVRFPEHGATIDRLLRATDRYRELKRELAARRENIDLPAGYRLGDYEIVDVLGRGGMGVVYRARQLSLDGRLVALKVLPAERHDPDRVRRFRREALALAELHHPSLAQVFGFGEQDGHLYFAMSLIEGVTLSRVLGAIAGRGDGWSRDESRRIVGYAVDLAAALSVVHAAGLVHRDVKPSNVILETRAGDSASLPEARAVLVDFGLVRDLESGSAATATCASGATPAYAPPEQLLGRPIDASADVFALGATLHDLLSRRVPEERGQAAAGIEPLTDVDRDLAAIVAKACDPEAKWRYADARAMHDDLVAWLAGEEVSARRPPLFERGSRFLRSHPRAAFRAAVLVASIACVAFLIGRLSFWALAAREAEWAAASGDVTRLVQSLDRLPTQAPALFVDEPAVAAFARAVRGIGASDERRKIVDRLRRFDPAAAVALAAERLEVFGLDVGEIETYVIESALRADPDEAPAVLEAAAFGVGRVFNVRPDWSPQDSSRDLRIHDATVRALAVELRRDPLESSDRLQWILVALSGCGTSDDLPALLALVPRRFPATPTDPFPETCRLALAAIERIVRRYHPGACGALTLEDWRRVRDGCAAAIEFALRDFPPHEAPFPDRCRGTAQHLFQALAFSEVVRERDERAALAALVPADWSGQPAVDALNDWSGRIVLSAPTHPREVAAEILAHRVEVEAAIRKEPARAGWLAGVCGDGAVLSVLQEPIRESAEFAMFEQGVRSGRDELFGIRDELMPRRLYPEEAVTVRRERDDRPEPGPESGWDFSTGRVVWSGSARAVTTDAVIDAEEAMTYTKRLTAPGRSLLDLEFESPPQAGRGVCRIEIHAKFGVRNYTPFGGVALLDVRLDDREVCSALAITDSEHGEYPLTQFDLAHVPGQRHHLVLKSNPRSLAQIWIERVTATFAKSE